MGSMEKDGQDVGRSRRIDQEGARTTMANNEE
jgi:hypothetical protein